MKIISMNNKTAKTTLTGVALAALFFASACSTLSHGNGKAFKVKGTVSVQQPACGTETQASTGPIANMIYYIKDGQTNDQSVIANKQLKTDENGNFSINLEPGTYAVLHPDKLMNYAEFKLKHSSQSTYFKDRDDDCFKRWYNSADFLLTISSDTTVALLVKSRCYTNSNPCAEYTGPK